MRGHRLPDFILPQILDWYYLLIVATGIYCLALSLSNILFLRLHSKRPTITEGPRVSVLVPARNEEDNIAQCLDSLVGQTYLDFEIIVFDDMSSDRTLEIATEYERRYDNVKVVRGTELPNGWYGKPHAMQELARHATGEYYLFTDADTVHRNDSISWAVTNIVHHDVAALSGSPRHTTETLGEVVVVPNMYLNFLLFLPLWLIPSTKTSLFSHMVGQFVIFKASVFSAIGGYGFVRHHISEDIFMGRELKRLGHKIIFLDAQEHVTCRMYRGFRAAVNGLAKNIFDFFDKKLYPIVMLSVFISLFTIAPIVILAAQLFGVGDHLAQLVWGVSLFFFAWLALLYDRGASWCAPLIYPVLFTVLLGVAWKSVFDDTLGKGYVWKGRIVR